MIVIFPELSLVTVVAPVPLINFALLTAPFSTSFKYVPPLLVAALLPPVLPPAYKYAV